MEIQVSNPWNVENLDEFLYFCCPECDLRNSSKVQFLQHALEKHPKAIECVQHFNEFVINEELTNMIKSEAKNTFINHNSYDQVQDIIQNVDIKLESSNNDCFNFINEIEISTENIPNNGTWHQNTLDNNDNSKAKKLSHRCGKCTGCLKEDCGKCHTCIDKPKFGGNGTRKQACINRSCTNLIDKCCTMCNKMFLKKSTLKEHMEVNHQIFEQIKAICDICGKEFSDNHHLKTHKNAKICCKEVACDFCGKIFTNINKLKSHKEIVHEGIKNFKCITCDRSFSTLKNQRRHQKRVHDGLMKNAEVCTLCGKNLSAGSLASHMKAIHSDERNELCKICGEAFKTSKSLRYHTKTVHEGIKVVHKYKCDQCEQSFSSESRRNDHVSGVHEGIKNHICSHCGAAYGSLNGLEFHIKAKHEGISYNCEKCDKSFHAKHYLMHHIKTVHEGKRRFKCDFCTKTFAHREGMKCHIKTVHEGVRYECDFCEKSFTQLPNLKKHVSDTHQTLQHKKDGLV